VQNKANLEAWLASGNPSYRTNPIRQGQLCETNPIWLVSRSPTGRNAQNEPNSGPAGRDEASGTRDECAKRSQFGWPAGAPEGEMRKTNPILRWRIVRNKPNLARAPRNGRGRPGSDCAKQSQFPPEQRKGQVLCRKGVMVNRTCNRLRQNKANLPARPRTGIGRGVTSGSVAQAYCAKQTQFAAGGQGRPSPRPGALTMPPAGQTCETKPISA
jgi:hypothetical protein